MEQCVRGAPEGFRELTKTVNFHYKFNEYRFNFWAAHVTDVTGSMHRSVHAVGRAVPHGGRDAEPNRGREMVRGIYSFLRSKSGAAAAEYALILAIIGAGIAAGILVLGQDISSALSSAGAVIKGFVY